MTEVIEVEVQALCSCNGEECGGWQLLDSIGRVWPAGPLLSYLCAGTLADEGGGWEPFTTEEQPGSYARSPRERPRPMRHDDGIPREPPEWAAARRVVMAYLDRPVEDDFRDAMRRRGGF